MSSTAEHKFVNTYLHDIIKEQKVLNPLYHPDWESTYNDKSLMISAIGELVELSNELPHFTKFFGGYTKTNFHLALEEFVDILHFMATRVILSGNESGKTKVVVDPEVIKSFSVNDFILKFNSNILTPEYKLIDFHELFIYGCHMFKVSPDLMLTAYLHKNSKNKLRAMAGAHDFDIKDIKDSEICTYDFLFGSSFIKEEKDEYNARLRSAYEQRM